LQKNVFSDILQKYTELIFFKVISIGLFLIVCISCSNSHNSMPGESDFYQGVQSMKKYDTAKAINSFSLAINKGLPPEKSGFAYLERGACYDSVGMFEEALTDYSYFINYSSNQKRNLQIACYVLRAQVYIKINETSKAKKDLIAARNIAENDGIVYSMLGILELKNGMFAEALKNADLSIKFSSKKPYGFCLRGAILEVQGKYEEAHKSYVDIYDKDEERSYTAEQLLANLLYIKGELKEALKYANNADVRNKSTYAKISKLLLTTKILNELDRTNEKQIAFILAKNCINDTIILEPYNMRNYSSLIQLFCETDTDVKEAYSLIEKVLKMKYSSTAYDAIAFCYYKSHKYESAEKYMLSYLKNSPVDLKAMYQLGLIYKAQGNVSKAKQTWNKLLKINPKYRFALKELEDLI
jgi:tetratricopeptide (TPR) repeat protein